MKEQLHEALSAAKIKQTKNEKISLYIINYGEIEIAYKDIRYIETVKRNVQVHTINGDYVSNAKITELENQMQKYGFFRIYKSYLVNLDYIKDVIGKKDVELANGEKLYLSSKKKEGLCKALMAWKYRQANG